MCITFSPKQNGNLPLSVFLLIPFICHIAVSSHAITLLSFLEHHSMNNTQMDNVWIDRQIHLTLSPHYTFTRYVQRMLENHTTVIWIRDYMSLLGGGLVFMLVASKRVTDDQRRSPERLG
jgi:hypothetical protein